MRFVGPSVVALAALTSAPSTALGNEDLPWVPPGALPLSREARSVAILRRDEPLYTRPDSGARRRGAALLGARLPLYGVQPGPGCRGQWLLVGPTAWLCRDSVHISADSADPAVTAMDADAKGLPLDYYFVGPNGSLGYADLSLAEEGAPDAELQPGFFVAITQVARKRAGDPFGLTTKRLWVPMRDLAPVAGPSFSGELVNGKLDVGWVLEDDSPVYEEPGGTAIAGERRSRLQPVTVMSVDSRRGRTWIQIGARRWMRSADLRVATGAVPPGGLAPKERWIDVDVDSQILTAYEGDTPVFSTLVSTGKGKGDHPQATPKGVHRVWVKLRTSDMTNLENEDASRYYAIEEVPWVMFFDRGYGLHGAFWHDSFGRVRSHGCVNLAPRDAQRLFAWASPHLPAGWSAVLPTDYDPGTVVRIR